MFVLCSDVYALCVLCVQTNTAKKRYEVGLSKLANTETSVSAMQVGCGPEGKKA